MRCRRPEKIWAVVRIGDETIAVVETVRPGGKPFYVGKLAYGHIPDDAPEEAFFGELANAQGELARLERMMRS